MPFWKKSEDPWDYEPEKPSRPAEPGQEEKDCAPSLMDELRGWNEERKEKKALRETPPPPMICPWCGQEMEVGRSLGDGTVSSGGPAGPTGSSVPAARRSISSMRGAFSTGTRPPGSAAAAAGW